MTAKNKENVSSRISKNARAGIHFPIAKVQRRLINSGLTNRVGAQTAIWIAASCQYVLNEIIEQAGQNCEIANKKRIGCRDVVLAVRNDKPLDILFGNHVVLVGDKIKKATEDFTIEADKRYKSKVEEMNASSATKK